MYRLAGCVVQVGWRTMLVVPELASELTIQVPPFLLSFFSFFFYGGGRFSRIVIVLSILSTRLLLFTGKECWAGVEEKRVKTETRWQDSISP